jgi:hypothetical protein
VTVQSGSGAGATPSTRADRLIRVGVVVFVVGLVAVAVAVIPSFFGAENLPTWLNAVAGGGLTVGFGLALAGVAAAVRAPLPDADDPDLYVTNPHDPGERQI